MGKTLLCALLSSAVADTANAQAQLPRLDPVGGAVESSTVLGRLHFEYSAVQRWRRVDAFRKAWDAAASDERTRVSEILQSLRSPGAPSEWWPDLGSIEVATRVLAGQDDKSFLAESKSGALTVQAAALALRVVPGAFEARPKGRTTSLVVRVSPLFELREALDVKLSLIWVSPEGAETLARTETIGASAFRAPGFEMYIRAPHTGPSVWTLVAELEPAAGVTLEELQEGETANFDSRGTGAMLLNSVRSYGIPVPALLDPTGELARERGYAATKRSGVDQLAPRALAEVNRPVLALDRLLAEGLRISPVGSIPFAEYWRTRAGSAEQSWSARVADRNEQLRLSGDPHVASPFDVLRVTPTTQIGGDLTSGLAATRWASLGRVFNVTPSNDGVRAAIGLALSELKASGSVSTEAPPSGITVPKRVLILSGDGLMAAQLESLRHGKLDADYLVIVANSWRPTPIFPTIPTLFLSPNEAVGKIAAAAPHVTAKVLPYSVFLSELEVPLIVAEWLKEFDSIDSSEEPKE